MLLMALFSSGIWAQALYMSYTFIGSCSKAINAAPGVYMLSLIIGFTS